MRAQVKPGSREQQWLLRGHLVLPGKTSFCHKHKKFLCMSVYLVYMVYAELRKGVVLPLELGLEIVVSHHVGSGT